MTAIPASPDASRARFADLAAQLVADGTSDYERRSALAGLLVLAREASGFVIDPHSDIGEGETRTRNGLAVSPTQAAMCADDIARTLAFVRALHQATLDVRAQFPSDRPVRVLYAGSGPYATLALPTMALLDPAQVRFTILDLHEASVSAARASVEELGFAGHVDRIEVADACEYRIDPTRPPDIILTETMQSGLENESQVVIARHLMAQAPEALLLPERVTVSAYLMDPGREFTFIEAGEDPAPLDHCPSRIRLGPIFELSREAIAAWGASTGETLPAGRIRMPAEVDSAFSAFLCTEIQVYRDLVLGIRDSGLTTPRTFPFPPGRGERAGGAYQFTYHLAAPPGLRCEVVEEEDLPAFPLQGHGDVIP